MLVPFGVGLLVTVLLFLGLSLVSHERYVYLFFYRSWYVQAITSWLFFAAMGFVLLRLYRLGDERRILSEKVSVERLHQITPVMAKDILEVIPAKYLTSTGFRRLDELLRGYLHGEEVIRLNQELSRRDAEQIEVGHLVLNALRQLIPVLGFLGTVVGLSLGMIRFPEIAAVGQNIDALRAVLKTFAASLSVAFDTTLLALAYTVIVVLITSMLRHSEESFVAEVDHKARMLIMKLVPMERPELTATTGDSTARGMADDFRAQLERIVADHLARWMSTWQVELLGTIRQSLENLGRQSEAQAGVIGESLRANGQDVIRKLDELKSALNTPPNYEITVHAVESKHHG